MCWWDNGAKPTTHHPIDIRFLIDNMTSPGSTFPFGEVECRQYLSIFEGFRCEAQLLTTPGRHRLTVFET